MKKKEMIILVAVLAVFCSGAFTWLRAQAAHAKSLVFPKRASREIVTDTVDLSEFNDLDVDVASINTYLEYGDSYKLEYRVYKDSVPEISQKNKHLEVKQPSHFRIHFFDFGDLSRDNEEYYKLTVPKNSEVLKVDLEASSGKIEVEDVDIKGKVEISSGNIKLKNIDSEELTLCATSGDIDIDTLKLDELRLNLTSGNLEAENCSTSELDAKMTSGRMDIKKIKFDKADIDMTSGDMDIEVEGKESDYSYEFDATSGAIRLNGKKMDDEYRFGDNDDNLIKAEVTSGDMNITFAN